MNKIGGYLLLMRPVNCIMMGFAVVVGAALAYPGVVQSSWRNITYGFVTGFMLTAASMAMNDYYDREIDAVNEPNRPIPSGLIQPKEALIFALVLTAIGLVAALLVNTLCLLIAVIAWVVFIMYTTMGKRSGLPGNFLVSICVAIPFVYGSFVVLGSVGLNVLVFSSIAFLSNTGREITKGIVDVRGDKTQNVKTLAVRYGEKVAAVSAAFFYVFAVMLSPTPWALGLVSFWFIPLVAVTDFGLLASSFMVLKDYSRESARRVKNTVLIWFAFALLAFIVGVLKV